jgi:hypothetical protein
MTIDQVIYCSPECFNELDPPSSSSHPASHAPLSEELSDAMPAFANPKTAAPSATKPSDSDELGSDPSVILTPPSDDASDAAYLGVSPVLSRRHDESTLSPVSGTRRALLSSSCFFHPDTSAIILCVNCRNPICSLCAREVPEGLVCSPSCGPLDRAGDLERRRLMIFNAALIGTVVLVLIESLILLRGLRQEWAFAAERAEAGTEDADPLPVDPELRQAAILMLEAESILRVAAEAAHSGRRASIEPPALKAKVGGVAEKLRQAREIYAARMVDSPDPAAVKSRIDTISALLDGLRSSDDPDTARARKPAAPLPPDGQRKRNGD